MKFRNIIKGLKRKPIKNEEKKIDNPQNKKSYEDEFLEFVINFEAHRLYGMARVYKTKNLKTASPSKLLEERDILQEKSKRLQNAAQDYAFSGHEASCPDYEKAVVYGKIALNELEKAIAYHERGFE